MAAHQLGADDDTDLFAVGFSSSDVIGHTYGMDSQEEMDEYLRLDLTLGRLLAEVDRRVGLDRVIIGLSADHGSMPLVEQLVARGVAARRVRTAEIQDPVTRALEARFGAQNGIVARYSAPDFYFDLEAMARRGWARRDGEAVAEKALLDTGLVEKVYTHERLLGNPPQGDPYFALMRRSFYEPRSPHLTVLLKDWTYMSDRPGGTGHGTPYEHDRHVPVVFLGSTVKPGTYAAACGPEDIAPTLAALLHLDYPLQDADRVLTEMMRGE
jgi:arylsulfatase A-like enzyme